MNDIQQRWQALHDEFNRINDDELTLSVSTMICESRPSQISAMLRGFNPIARAKYQALAEEAGRLLLSCGIDLPDHIAANWHDSERWLWFVAANAADSMRVNQSARPATLTGKAFGQSAGELLTEEIGPLIAATAGVVRDVMARVATCRNEVETATQLNPPLENRAVFCLHNGGARFEGFGQSAVLSSLRGIPRLHAIVYAGSKGVRMADLMGVASGDELGSRDDAFDKDGRAAIMASLERLQRERAEAEEFGNQDEAARIRHEQLEITKQLTADSTRRGGARDINSRVNSWRATISDSLDTVYSKLRQQDAGLIADHLKAYVCSTGTDEQTASFVYNPPAGTPPWQDSLT